MAVPIVVGDSWAENSADDFVEHCRKFDYFENLSDEALKCVYRVADMCHFGIHVAKATDEIAEIAEIMPVDVILHNYWSIGLLNKLLIECRFLKEDDELDFDSVDLENLSYMVRTYVDIDEFLAAINKLESINDYTYYLTKNYWTFVCISDSIFI